jgi:hypothetical protein
LFYRAPRPTEVAEEGVKPLPFRSTGEKMMMEEPPAYILRIRDDLLGTAQAGSADYTQDRARAEVVAEQLARWKVSMDEDKPGRFANGHVAVSRPAENACAND